MTRTLKFDKCILLQYLHNFRLLLKTGAICTYLPALTPYPLIMDSVNLDISVVLTPQRTTAARQMRCAHLTRGIQRPHEKTVYSHYDGRMSQLPTYAT